MRLIGRGAVLTALWVLLWGEISVANLLSGAAVATVLMVVFPIERPSRFRLGRVRPIGFLRLVAHVAAQLVVSNAVVAREILSRGSRVRTAIVACRLRSPSEPTMTMVANIIALSPGLMAVDLRQEPPTVYVHVLHFRDVAETRRHIAHLEMLVIRAIGSSDELALVAPLATTKVAL